MLSTLLSTYHAYHAFKGKGMISFIKDKTESKDLTEYIAHVAAADETPPQLHCSL